MNQARRKRIENIFRNIHAISDFKWLNDLDSVKGLDVGDTYNNHQAATHFRRGKRKTCNNYARCEIF